MPKVENGIMAGSKSSSMRRSQRRINKLLDKNISQYQIPNPYKNSKTNCYLPKNLTKQLSKMNFFSIKTLQNLHFSQPSFREEVNELLSKMRVAVQKQSEDLTSYIALMSKKPKKNSQRTTDERQDKNIDQIEIDQLNDSVFMPRNSENSIQLHCLNQPYQNLPLVSHQSEGASMMSDNYEVDKLIFSTNQHLFRQMEEQLELYEA